VVTKFIPGVGTAMTVVSGVNAAYHVGKGIKKAGAKTKILVLAKLIFC